MRSKKAAASASGFAAAFACAALALAQAPTPLLKPFGGAQSTQLREPWRIETLEKLPRHTRFEVVPLEGKLVLRVSADASYANLVHPVNAYGAALRWRWRVERMSLATDLARKSGDDVPARLCVLFDVPLERLDAAERWKLRLGRFLFGAELPPAGVCYVWDARLPAGTWLPNAYTDRVQMLVLRSAASGHAQSHWYEESRDVRADFAQAFPVEARDGPVPIAAVAVSADGDDTGAVSIAYFDDVVLEPPLP